MDDVLAVVDGTFDVFFGGNSNNFYDASYGGECAHYDIPRYVKAIGIDNKEWTEDELKYHQDGSRLPLKIFVFATLVEGDDVEGAI